MAFAVDNNQEDDFFVSDDFVNTTRIMVFGVGGAGGNAVAHMTESDIKDVTYVIANTDVAALRDKDATRMKRIQLGRKITFGQGAGNDPAKGKASAEETIDEIAKELEGVSMLFVTAGMGGGTGTGAAPVIAKLAKEKKILTIGVVTKPFKYERELRMETALKGIAEMKQYVDALIVIPNESLMKFKGQKLTVADAYKKVDEILSSAVLGLIRLLQSSGVINVDFMDVSTTLQNSGIAHIAIGHGKGDNKLKDAIEEVTNSPLLETSITGARRGLINITIPEGLFFDELDSIAAELSEKFAQNAQFKVGFVTDKNLEDDEIMLIVVATDFDENAAAPVGRQIPSESSNDVDPAEDSVPTVTVTPTSEGLSGNVGLSSNADMLEMDALLKKFNRDVF